MYPDNIHHQAPDQGSLPQVQAAAFMREQPVQATQPIQAAAAAGAVGAHGAMPESLADQVKLLTRQYGANPYAFNAAFQQLKARYLLDHYNIDPNAEKK